MILLPNYLTFTAMTRGENKTLATATATLHCHCYSSLPLLLFITPLLLHPPFQRSMHRPATYAQTDGVAIGVVPAFIFNVHGIDVGREP
jgi:hypothetical protein